MDPFIKNLQDEQDKASARAKTYGDAIAALQQVCDHKMAEDGHDSHHNWFKCTECGVTEKDG